MTTNIKVTPRPSRGPIHAPSKDHHVGNPPTSFHNPWPSAGEKAGLGALLSARFGSERNFVPVPQGPNGTRSQELVKTLAKGRRTNYVQHGWVTHQFWWNFQQRLERRGASVFSSIQSSAKEPVLLLGLAQNAIALHLARWMNSHRWMSYVYRTTTTIILIMRPSTS